MMDPQAYWRVADILGREDFADDELREIWIAIEDLRKAGLDADSVTVGEKHPRLFQRAFEVVNNTPGASNVRGYAKWVLSAATERRVNAAGQRIAKLRGDDAVGEAQRILASCHPRAMSAVRSMREFVQESVLVMQQRCDSTEALTGVPTSLEWLDEQTAGWQRGDLIILAARPSVGKTAFALQACLYAAAQKHPVFLASLEQSGAQIAERSIAHLAGVSMQHILQPKRIEEHEWPRVSNAGADLAALPMMIDETGALTVEAISARVRQVNAERRLGLVAIDYLTQIQPPRADKTADAIQAITRALKALAKELAVPVLLLSQLNREGEARPALTTLRDSGAIEQDADVVIFLHRPQPDRRELVELTIAKQRNGPCDSVYLHADMERMRFLPTEERPNNVGGQVSFARRRGNAGADRAAA
jgi:replicative DNA helicase